MSRVSNYPIYRKVKDKKIYIKIDKSERLTSIGLDFGREGRCHYDNTKRLANIPTPLEKQLRDGSGEYETCTEREFLAALKYALDSPELIKETLV